MTARLSDWEARLAEYIASVTVSVGLANVLGGLGDVPCARFAAGAVEAQTGVDHYKPFRGRYRNELGAAKALKKYGAGTLEATFDRHLDPRSSPAFAQRGDIVFDGEAVGVCVGGEALFIGHEIIGDEKGPLTIIRKARPEWVKAWAVGGLPDE